MKPTPEDFKPRRDGWLEHSGRWDEVTVGTILAQRDTRTQAWEVIATSHGDLPIPFNSTLWLRLRNVKTGEEITLPPRGKNGTVVILTRDPNDTQTAPPTEPTDTDAVMNVIAGLGATHLATRDEATGIIFCPDYVWTGHVNDGEPHPLTRGLLEHLEFAHYLKPTADVDYAQAISRHGQLHKSTGHTQGFAHVHLPEEDILNDFVRNRRIKDLIRSTA